MAWLATLVPAGVRNAALWAGALALAILAGLVAGLRLGADRERLRRADNALNQRNRADEAAAEYRGAGGARDRLQRRVF